MCARYGARGVNVKVVWNTWITFLIVYILLITYFIRFVSLSRCLYRVFSVVCSCLHTYSTQRKNAAKPKNLHVAKRPQLTLRILAQFVATNFTLLIWFLYFRWQFLLCHCYFSLHSFCCLHNSKPNLMMSNVLSRMTEGNI